ncbi:MAG: hydantoinase/oxoprolinase family protein [Burkholderiales bacterium]|nr:hydantoinase/oxoprolinase family protein [Burkholderiales bacterium]
MNAPRYRIGVDIGGTFTDFVLQDTATGRLHNEKVLTTPADPSQAVLAGVRLLLARHGIAPAEVAQVIHGTTLVANALIERKGVTTALVTTRGFADVPEIGLEWRYDTYDLKLELPPPLAPRARRFEVAERVGPDGAVLEALDEDSVRAVARALAAGGVAAAAVCLLHAFRNPVHEERVRDILREAVPGLVVCTSSDVVPEIGEYERMTTTLANAYVLPIFEKYLGAITRELRALGIARDLTMMLSDGGTVHESTAIRHPVRLVQSGPAGGVQATTLIGAAAGAADVFCFDMGGTTAKACLIDNGEPLRSTQFEVARVYRFKRGSGLPLRIPVIDMIEIGAGGGSIARIDRLGLLQVGPDSSSADPGPACYGQGGTDATVTDADLVLGYLGADSFLGGDMRLDVAAARAAVAERIGAPLGLAVEQAAWGIHDLVNENMARAAAIHALEKARRITDYAMVPIGGAGPVHAAHIAQKLGLARVICPLGAGVASAFGFLAAPTAFAFVHGRVEALGALDFGAVNALLDDMEAQGRALLATAGTAGAGVEVRVEAAMRYLGQGYEIDVALERAAIARADTAALGAAFARTYERLFGRVEDGVAVEVVSWRLGVHGPRPQIALAASRDAAPARAGTAIKGRRAAWFAAAGGFVETTVYDRYAFAPGSTAAGPALFEERESTLVVPPGARVRCDESLNLVIDF